MQQQEGAVEAGQGAPPPQDAPRQRPAPFNIPEAEYCCCCANCPLDKGALGVAAFEIAWNVIALLVSFVGMNILMLVWSAIALVCSSIGAVGACQLTPCYLKVFLWWMITYGFVGSIIVIIDVALLPSIWPTLLLWFLVILPVRAAPAPRVLAACRPSLCPPHASCPCFRARRSQIQIYLTWIVWSTLRKVERGEIFLPASAAVVQATHASTAMPAAVPAQIVTATVVSSAPASAQPTAGASAQPSAPPQASAHV